MRSPGLGHDLVARARWRSRLRLRVLVACVVGSIAAGGWPLAVDLAFARPGGGGSYHGGGGGGGSSHSGGGGSSHSGGGGFTSGSGFGGSVSTNSAAPGDIAGLLIALLLFGSVFAYVGIIALRQSRDRSARWALRAAQERSTAQVRAATSLEGLRAGNPSLTWESIAGHVLPMADILRGAWCGGDMRPARPFVSDGIYGRYQVQLRLMRQENRRNVMGDARVLATSLEAVEDAGPLEVVHVRVRAEARDTEVPVDASEDRIRATLARAPIEPYTEIWSLVRRTGAQTKPSDFPVGLACPACGAPLGGSNDSTMGSPANQGVPPVGETVKCRYCGALVCSGEHDWVLAEITQLEEWHPTSRSPPGYEDLRVRDPGVAREVLEDRASYVFWKWVQAGRDGALAPLRPLALPSAAASGARTEWTRGATDIAVGGAELALCETDGAENRDRAYVTIFWSARFGGSAAPTPVQTVVALARTCGVRSKVSMTALVCQACGAPLVETDSTRCDHCQAELTSGDQAWVLEAILRPDELSSRPRSGPRKTAGTPDVGADSSEAGPTWMPDVADPRERRVLFARMVQLMASDGAIDRNERRLLQTCALRWDIAPEQVEQAISHPPEGDYGASLGTKEPEWFLAALVAAALADGTIDSRERLLLEHACAALGLPRDSVDRRVAEVRQRMQAAHA